MQWGTRVGESGISNLELRIADRESGGDCGIESCSMIEEKG